MNVNENLNTTDDHMIHYLDAFDNYYLQLAFTKKNTLQTRPYRSNFRVFCIILYRDIDGVLNYVCGTNNECSNIGQSICAERNALGALRLVQYKTIERLYIVSDAPTPLNPGLLCREFLSQYICNTTPIILGSETTPSAKVDASNNNESVQVFSNHMYNAVKSNFLCHVKVTCLRDVYPYPSLYSVIPSSKLLEFARNFNTNAHQLSKFLDGSCLSIDDMMTSEIKTHEILQLCDLHIQPTASSESDEIIYSAKLLNSLFVTVRKAIALDNRDHIHDLRYAAIMLLKNGQILVSNQTKVGEYGHSIDAVTSLYSIWNHMCQPEMKLEIDSDVPKKSTTNTAAHKKQKTHAKHDHTPLLVIQIDQFGILHAPFAPARAVFSEQGVNFHMLCHNENGDIVCVDMKEFSSEIADVSEGLALCK